MAKLVYGVGVNDADYKVSPTVNGKQVRCKIYSAWMSMLCRCYCQKYISTRPNYLDCYVCSDWLVFSNFKAWMEQQDWQGKCLDKDILMYGNKLYSPEACVFVSALTNSFITDRGNDRGEFKIVVSWYSAQSKFRAECHNPFSGKGEKIGFFEKENDAHLAWKKRKHELACKLAELQTDSRVAEALRARYQ